MASHSKCIEGSSHYLGDKQDFDVSSKGPSSGISGQSDKFQLSAHANMLKTFDLTCAVRVIIINTKASDFALEILNMHA